jgi:hypothetical protein
MARDGQQEGDERPPGVPPRADRASATSSNQLAVSESNRSPSSVGSRSSWNATPAPL